MRALFRIFLLLIGMATSAAAAMPRGAVVLLGGKARRADDSWRATLAAVPGAQVARGGKSEWVVKSGEATIKVKLDWQPLAKPLVDEVRVAAGKLAPADERALAEHRGNVTVIPEGERASAELYASVLVALLRLDEAVGYAVPASVMYRPKGAVTELLAVTTWSPTKLLLLLTNLHVVDGKWVHTHGLEQFGLPDLEIRSTDPRDAAANEMLIRVYAAEAVEKGPTLKPGDTADGQAGKSYRIEQSRKDPAHPYGKYGALIFLPAPAR